MKTHLLLPLVLVGTAPIALAQPVALTDAEMDWVTGGKITEVITDTYVENPAGKQPPGQQEGAQGSSMETIVETENQNPSGHAPPGHNK